VADRPPSPIGEKPRAMAADRPRASVVQVESHGKTPVARYAVIVQQLAMRWADTAFGEHPAGSKMRVVARSAIGSEASETDWDRPGHRRRRPFRSPAYVPGSSASRVAPAQGQAMQPIGVDTADLCPNPRLPGRRSPVVYRQG
jgi:hypothetical protein